MNPNKTIRTIMTTDLVKVYGDEKLARIKELFDANNFHHLLVINNDLELKGVISNADFYRFVYHLTFETSGQTYSTKKYHTVEAKEIMTQFPYVLDPDDTIGLAADLFLGNKFHALPVVEGKELVGIVTSFDLLKYAYNSPVEDSAAVAYEETI